MAYTGYKIIQYIDENPNSETYGQTWTERVQDTTNCPEGEEEWTLISSECELTTSGYTGNRINLYYNSATGEYSSTTTSDSSCSASTLDEIWIDYGDVYCEENEDGTYTGWGIQEQKQTNSNLLNYGEIRKIRVQDASCADEMSPQWQEITRQCHISPDLLTCNVYFDGTVDIVQIDINPSSPSFNQTRTITGYSEDCVCENCDSVEESWRYVADYCGNQMPVEYNLSQLTDDTIYHVYRMYETCIVGGNPRRTRPTNEYSAVTYQTGVSDCMYRWADTEETVCVEQQYEYRWVVVPGEYECSGTTKMTKEKQQASVDSGETWTDTGQYRTGSTVIEYNSTDCGYVPPKPKVKITYSNGDVYELACNESTTLTSGETNPSGYEYSAITGIVIGDCVDAIGNYAFNQCSGLTSIEIPSGITSIGSYAFKRCSGLTSVDIPNSVTSIGSNAFANCSGLTSANIPTGLTSIPESLFDYDRHIDGTLEIPSGVTSIGNYAFWDCENLDAIICRPVVPPTAGSAIFGGSTSCPVYVPCESVDAYKAASGWSNYASRIQAIPGTCFDGKFKVTYQGGQTYSAECNSDTTLRWSDLTISGYERSGITDCIIGNCITVIGNSAFDKCKNLTGLTIPSTITSIGNSAIRECYSLPSVIIPNSVTSIGDHAFWSCTSLISVSLSNNLVSIDESAFDNCGSITSITIPNSVTTIGNSAFSRCSGMTSLSIGSGITSISDMCFAQCSILTGVTMPNSVTSIGEHAFSMCSSLKRLNSDTDGVANIPSGVTSFARDAFYGCDGLATIIAPSGVTSIGDDAFRFSHNLVNFTIYATTPPALEGNYSDGTRAFMTTPIDEGNGYIYVPSGSVNAYKNATNWSKYSSKIRAIPNS